MGVLELLPTGLAIYAAIVSTILLILQIREHRLARGNVDVSTSFHPGTDSKPSVVALHVTNKGSVPVTISKLELNGPGPVTIALPFGEMISGGPELPTRIEARSATTWHIDSNELKTVLRKNGWSYQVRGIVMLGTGKAEWESIHQYTTVQ